MLKNKKNNLANEEINIKTLQLRLFVIVGVVIFIVVNLITFSINSISSDITSSKVASLFAANCQQIELNINNYFNNVETTTTLLFADEDYYKYNPIKSKYDEYTAIKKEEAIADRIMDLGLMQNFSDFAVVYSDGNRVGWTSNTTAGLFDADVLYNELASRITNERTFDGWAFDIGGVIDRIYYVKRLNSDAILFTSFYSRELDTVFEYPDELDGMVINLLDENNRILYSSDKELIAGTLDEAVRTAVSTGNHDLYFANEYACENGWKVVSYIPSDKVLHAYNLIQKNSVIVAIIFGAIVVLGCFVLMRKQLKPVDSAVEELREEAESDKLTGLYNKQSFREEVVKALTSSSPEDIFSFIMIDMDNFKRVNDTYGHSVGDEVIVRMSKLIDKVFQSPYINGRLGGDEFAIFLLNSGDSDESSLADNKVIQDVQKLYDEFEIEFAKEKSDIGVSLSIGIALQKGERRFDNLYNNADSALYKSKNSGKNRYSIYEPQEENDETQN